MDSRSTRFKDALIVEVFTVIKAHVAVSVMSLKTNRASTSVIPSPSSVSRGVVYSEIGVGKI
jgi:hypothetical protein